MRRLLPSLLLTIAFVASPLLASDAEEDSAYARGARLYSANCGRCHNPRGPSEYSDREWPIVVTHMRVIAGLPGDQARAIQAFLQASNNPPRPRAPETPKLRAAPVASGEDLITQFGCRGCHEIGGQGGAVGPSLDGVFERRNEEWLRTQIQRPREHNPKTVMPQPDLGDQQVTAIIEALRRAQ